ncbi:MAG: tandem-95 repeat protein, partial [Verrucomicrobiales bacterium]|nr:tandem-95 repeat protein [Verrucomicrobiales bacterium]
VHLGESSYLVSGRDLTIIGTAANGVGVSAGMNTKIGAMGTLVEIRGEVTATGTGVAFDRVSVNDAVGTNAAVTIVGTGGNAAMNRGIELFGGLIIGSDVWLSGSATGETGLFLNDMQLFSGHGGPADLTLEGEGGHEGVHLGESSYLYSGRDLTINGTAANGVGVSAGMGTEIQAMGLAIEIQGEVTATGTGVSLEGVLVNQNGTGSSAVTVIGTGGFAPSDRGIELMDISITGNGIALDGTTGGETGIRLSSAQIFSNAGPVTMWGEGILEDVRLEGHNVMYSEERPEITGDVVFDQYSQFDLGISGHPDTSTGQILVNGTITIRPNAGLELFPSYHHSFLPTEGQSYVIFGNETMDAISGTFAGLPEGGAIADFIGSGIGATVSYQGGDGNDLVISTQTANTPPLLSPIGNRSVDEGGTLNFTASANDGDLPVQTLTYSLDGTSLAKGMTINAATGQFAWTPGEAQSGTHTVTVTVADNGPGALTDSETITITVNEVNQAPVLIPIGNQSVDEGTTLSFAVSASDADLPAQTLTYSLDPASLAKGMTIDAATGLFTWIPGEMQDGTHTVTFTVTDSGPGTLTDGETITITVNEVNQAPVLTAIGNRSVDEGAALNFAVSASDADRPLQSLTYSLDPASLAKGMTIDAASGAFAWNPGEALSGTHSVTITVTDNGAGALSDSETITITVNEVNQAPVIDPIANQSADTASPLSFAITASDADLPAQTLTYSLDAASLAKGMGIDAQSGQFTWSPTFSHGGNHSVTVTVTDSGPGSLSTTATFTIEVTVLNQPPTLSIDTAPASYTEDGAPATIAPGGLASDLEGNWEGGTLTARISSGAVATDRLRLGGGAVTLIGGNYLQIGGITIGRANTHAALGVSSLTITFNSAATDDHVQSVLRSLAFDSSSTTDPVAGPRSVSLQITDGGGLSSATATRQIDVISVNDPPRFVDLGGNAAYLIGQGAIVLDQSSTVIDEERSAANNGAGNYSGTRLMVGRAGGINAIDTFFIAPIAGITNTGTELRDSAGQAFATYTSLGGELKIHFTDTLGAIPTTALIQKVLQAIAYDNPSLAAGASLTIEFTFDDGEAIATGQVGLTAYDANSAGVNTDELIITTDGDGDSVQLTIADGVLRIRSADKSIIGGAGTATDANGDLYVNITGLNRIAFYLGASNDLISITNLTGFNGELIINGGDGQDEIQFGATLVAAAGRSIIFAAEEVKLNGATLETSGSGSIQIDSSGTGTDNFKGISIVNSTLRSTGSGTIEIQGEAGSLGGASQGVRLSGSSITTTGSDIRITGQGGGATSGNYGVVFESASTVSAGGSGNVTIQGTGGGGGSSSGIQLNSGSTITVMDGLLTLTGQGGGGSGNQNRGINLSGATVRATGSGSIILNGRGGGTGSTSGGVFLSGGSILTDGAGSILIQGTGSATGTNDNAGVFATNGVTLRSGSGDLVIDGQGGGTGSNNRGIYLSGAGTLVQTTTGAIRLTGRGSLTATGSYAEGILVQAASVLSSSGTIDLTGRGGTGNAHLYGVRLSGGSLSTTGTLALVGQGGTGSGIQNAGVWLFSGASATGGALSSITGTGGNGSSKCHGVYLLAGTTTIPTSQILGTAGTGTGSLDLAGTYFV